MLYTFWAVVLYEKVLFPTAAQSFVQQLEVDLECEQQQHYFRAVVFYCYKLNTMYA
jgi:hypothetical protein